MHTLKSTDRVKKNTVDLYSSERMNTIYNKEV